MANGRNFAKLWTSAAASASGCRQRDPLDGRGCGRTAEADNDREPCAWRVGGHHRGVSFTADVVLQECHSAGTAADSKPPDPVPRCGHEHNQYVGDHGCAVPAHWLVHQADHRRRATRPVFG
eukprot:scaffold744_cov111-Isochrysis_galbana.AAC.6